MKVFGNFVLILCAIAIPITASAEESIDSIFAKMDNVTNGQDDSMMDIHMTVYDIDGSKKAYDFKIYQKGTKRLIKFSSGELKGLATLVVTPSQVYAYLPSQKKIRRVATHKMGQSMAGSDMTNDDAAFTSWPETFTPTLEKQDDKYWYVNARAKKNAPYPGVKLKIHKGDYLLAEYTFLNEKGGVIKTYACTDVRNWGGGVLRAKLVTIYDGPTRHKTTLELRQFKINQDLPDRMFTKRELEWGR